MTTRLIAALLLASATACTIVGSSTKPPAPSAALDASWAPFAFVVGEWQGTDSGSTGGGKGAFSLLPDLGGKVLARRNVNESPQGRHEDLMLIYREGDGFRAFYVDNENHVIHYAVAPGEGRLTLTSDEVPGRPRFRLTYQQVAEGKLDVVFAIQPPGGADFRTYLQGQVVRR